MLFFFFFSPWLFVTHHIAYIRESDRTTFFHFPNHVPQEISAAPHGTLHEIILTFVVHQHTTLDSGYCLLCLHR